MKSSSNFFLLTFLFSLLLMSSCNLDCELGTVSFVNDSFDTYDLYIDGAYECTIDGDSYCDVDLYEGFHHVELEQIDGFVFFSNVVVDDIDVVGCQDVEWVFP